MAERGRSAASGPGERPSGSGGRSGAAGTWIVSAALAVFCALCLAGWASPLLRRAAWIAPDGAAAVGEALRAEGGFRLDLNAATEEELRQLPGIGETLAKRILERREEFGPFESVEQLLEVEGIGPGKLEGILPLATAGAGDPGEQTGD